MTNRSKLLPAALSLLVLGGCATFSRDGGFGAVAQITQERLNKDTSWARSPVDTDRIGTTVKKLLSRPLTADDAVQLALLNNRGLQATYAELGIAEADLVQAGRLHNPGFTYQRTRQGDSTAIERTFTIGLIDLLTQPLALRVERRRFEQTKLSVANEALRVASETRSAYFEAVAATQTVKYMEQVKTAAEAGAELAARMARAGNWSILNQAREQVFYAEATAQLARAQQTSVAARERLTRLMGLWGDDVKFQLPERLPDLPADRPQLQDIEQIALRERLDIRAAKRQTESLAASLGLTKTTRFINVLELGYVRNNETDLPRATGYEITLELPLFDWGGARVAKAESLYMQAVNRVAEAAVNARSEVRESYQGYLTAYDLAKHYRDEIVPLRKKISEENQLRYNGMLISVFELLADAREQVVSVNGYIDALKEFWRADTGLQNALGGRLTTPPVTDGAGALPAPASPDQSSISIDKGRKQP